MQACGESTRFIEIIKHILFYVSVSCLCPCCACVTGRVYVCVCVCECEYVCTRACLVPTKNQRKYESMSMCMYIYTRRARPLRY